MRLRDYIELFRGMNGDLHVSIFEGDVNDQSIRLAGFPRTGRFIEGGFILEGNLPPGEEADLIVLNF